MTSLSIASPASLANVAVSRITSPIAARLTSASAEDAALTPSTLLTLTGEASSDVVYAKPKAVDPSALLPARAWASPPQSDSISALMARNSNGGNAFGLAGQWRGLGGALLSRLAATGSDYHQTLVDYLPAARASGVSEAGGVSGASAASLDAQALSAVQNDAAKVSLKIRTRSGQTVELKIAVAGRSAPGSGGVQLDIASSGPLTSGERQALAKLAKSFDQVMEGLGQPDKLKLDVSDLMDYDSSAFAGLDLAVTNPKAGQALSSFKLHLGSDENTIELQGAAGHIALTVDKNMPLGLGSAQQRQAAIGEHLRRFDAAAERSHADASLIALFKDAFTQLHSASKTGAEAGAVAQEAPIRASALGVELASQIQPLHSGLADFEASFHSDFEKTNERGAVIETGHADFDASQTTEVKQTDAVRGLRITQTQDQRLDAQSIRSRSGVMLDTHAGNYDIHKIADRNTSATVIETAKGWLLQALRQTDQHQLHTVDRLVSHRIDAQVSTPVDKSVVERLY